MRYWDHVFTEHDTQSVREKYALLTAMIAREGGARREDLRTCARRWPGALRECQLISPRALEQRHAQAADMGAAMTRGEHRQAGRAPLVLWHDLHGLLGSVAAFRRAGERRDDLQAFWELARERPAGFLLPATPGELPARFGTGVRPRAAYQLLAAACEWSLPRLHEQLFLREGHWDARPGDL